MRAAASAALLAAAALAPSLGAQTAWHHEKPAGTPHAVAFANPELTESSGVAASRTQPGVLWTHNDSGNDAVVYATDTLGRDLGSFEVTGATNVDWEAITVGPCRPAAARSCLFIGDIGDNLGNRPAITIYRVPEPRVEHGSPHRRPTARAAAVRARFPDGPRDAEAMLLTSRGDMLILNKGGAAIRLYRIPAAAWLGRRTVTAADLGPVPIVPERAALRLVTDAALAPDGVSVAVRTYREIFFLRLEHGRLVPARPPTACDAFGLQLQGEGVTWIDARHLALTSERTFIQAGSVAVISCPST